MAVTEVANCYKSFKISKHDGTPNVLVLVVSDHTTLFFGLEWKFLPFAQDIVLFCKCSFHKAHSDSDLFLWYLSSSWLLIHLFRQIGSALSHCLQTAYRLPTTSLFIIFCCRAVLKCVNSKISKNSTHVCCVYNFYCVEYLPPDVVDSHCIHRNSPAVIILSCMILYSTGCYYLNNDAKICTYVSTGDFDRSLFQRLLSFIFWWRGSGQHCWAWCHLCFPGPSNLHQRRLCKNLWWVKLNRFQRETNFIEADFRRDIEFDHFDN